MNNAKLMELHLQHNQIKSLEFNIKYEVLYQLNVANNRLTKFNLTALSKLAKNLEYLDLTENNLTHLDYITRENLSNLSKFGISRNFISQEKLDILLKSWQSLDFIGDARIQKIMKPTSKKAASTNNMMTVFAVVFSIFAIITIAVKFKVVTHVHKKLVRKIKDAVTLARYQSYFSTELNELTRSYGQYRKVEY